MNRVLLSSYAIFLALIVLFTYLFVDQNLSFLNTLYTGVYWSHRELVSLGYLLILLTFFSFYIIFIKNLRKINLKLIVGLTSVMLFFSYPAFVSYDIFNYMISSRVLVEYRENPYLIVPQEFVGDEYLPFSRATNKTALYGPSWTLFSIVPYVLGIGNFVLTLFSFKLVSLLSYLGLTYVIFKISKSNLSTALFAFNPLVVIETLISSHNDSFMMFLALISFYLLSKNKFFLSVSSLIISLFVKFATFFLLPIYSFVLFKVIRGEEVNWDNIFKLSAISMMVIFLLSFLREEIYPWYAIWFLSFSVLTLKAKWILGISLSLSIGLLLSYMPYMFLGTYEFSTPIFKYFFTFLPTAVFLILKIAGFKWKL